MMRTMRVTPKVTTEWGIEVEVLGNGISLIRTTFRHEQLVPSDEQFYRTSVYANALRDIREVLFPDSLSVRFWKFVSDQLYDWL